MTTQRRRLQYSNHRTRFVLSIAARWLFLPTQPSSVRRRLRSIVMSLFKALTQPIKHFVLLKSMCTADVSSNHVHYSLTL